MKRWINSAANRNENQLFVCMRIWQWNMKPNRLLTNMKLWLNWNQQMLWPERMTHSCFDMFSCSKENHCFTACELFVQVYISVVARCIDYSKQLSAPELSDVALSANIRMEILVEIESIRDGVIERINSSHFRSFRQFSAINEGIGGSDGSATW